MEEIKRNDLVFFKNDILQDIKKVEIIINGKISLLANQLENFNSLNNQKFEYYKDKYNEILEKSDTSEFQTKMKEKFEIFAKKMEDSIISNNIKIQKMEKELADSCYKYDKIYLKNMTSTGLIGDGCPYPTMKSFFVYVDKKIKELMKLSDKSFADFNSLKSYLDKAIEAFDKHIELKGEEFDKNTDEKLIQFEKKIEEKKKYLEDRFEHIRVDNGKYIYNIIKNQETINEKLKLELKKYSVINEALIKHYNDQSKALNNTNKIQSHYSYLFSKSSKKNQKKKTTNLNDLLPTLKKIEENFNIKDAFHKNEDLKDLKLKIEDNHKFEIKNQKKITSNKEFIKSNKNFIRRGTLNNFNFHSNLFYHNFNLYRDWEDNNNHNIRTIFTLKEDNNNHNKKNNNYRAEEKQKEIEEDSYSKLNININNEHNAAKSEKKIFGKITEKSNIYRIQSRKNILMPENNKVEIILNKDRNVNNNINKKIHTEEKLIKSIINNYKIKEKNASASEKKLIKTIVKKDEKKVKKEEKKEKEILDKEYEIKEEVQNEKKDINLNNNTISYYVKDEDKKKVINMNKGIEIKLDKKINRVYKFIEQNNIEINKKYDALSKQIFYLYKEINKLTKDNFKLKNKIVFTTHTSNNSTVDNINLNNLYISNNSIVPIKSSEKTFKSLRYTENSNSFNSSDNKYIKTINNRVINNAKTINDDSDKDNYCFLINKIEPYLIKKFQNT